MFWRCFVDLASTCVQAKTKFVELSELTFQNLREIQLNEYLDSEIVAELVLRLSFWFEIGSGIQEWQDRESGQSWISNN